MSLSAQPLKPTILTTNVSNPNQFGNNGGTASIKSGAPYTNLNSWGRITVKNDDTGSGISFGGAFVITNAYNTDTALHLIDTGNSAEATFINGTWTGSFAGDGGSVTNLSIINMDNPTFLAMAKGMESGNTFSNINRYIWTNWYAKLRLTTTTTQQITIAAVVDGLGSIGLMTKTALSPTNFGLPVVGYMNGIFPQWVGFVAGNAVQGGEHDGLWYPGGWFNLPGQNDSVTFKDFFAVGPLANAVTVYYVKEPGAGHIKVETNINGGSFGVANASIDAANATFDAGVFSVTNALGLGNVQVKITEIDSGKSVKILYPKIWNTKSNGIIFATFQGSGSDVPANILTTNLLFSGKVWNDINPTLLLDSRVTFTDDGGATVGATYTNILAWYRFCKTNFTTTDIVLAGEYPNANTSGINTLDEYIVRTNAQYYGFGYFDGWSPFVSQENFFKRGWSASLGNVHATAAGVVAYENVLIHWLDLFWGGSVGGGGYTGWQTNTAAANGFLSTNDVSISNTLNTTGSEFFRSGRVDVGGNLTATNGTDFIGTLNFPADLGGPLIDVSVTSATTGGTQIGYTNRIDGTDIERTIAYSDGSGGITNPIVQFPFGTASLRSNALASAAITFPATTVKWTNTFGMNIVLYIDNSGVTGTATVKNNQQIFSSLVGDVTLLLKSGDYFSETYTIGTPTARWEPQ